MQFLREKQDQAVEAIASHICNDLQTDTRVLWLVSGGSNVKAEAAAMRLLRKNAKRWLSNLAIMPMDERYGPQGHADSNTEQLRQAGFDPGDAVWIDVLMHGLPFEQTVSFYDEVASVALAHAGSIVGQFGLGSDGHTAGILPDSPATKSSKVMVVGYHWNDYERMTLTKAALSKVQTAYVLAYGANKKEALVRLQKNAEPLAQLPAKILYEIPKVYIYNEAINSEG